MIEDKSFRNSEVSGAKKSILNSSIAMSNAIKNFDDFDMDDEEEDQLDQKEKLDK